MTLTIGMYGGGTVGGGVYELIMDRYKADIKITKICVRDVNKPRSYKIDESITKFISDPDEIVNDESIDCVVEVMGGTGLAKTVVEAALKKGKAVVTANKALLAEHWGSVQECMKSNPKARLAWEAAVCGGIPIIQLLQTAYFSPTDEIGSIMGICNGTTNFMLTEMFQKGAAYDEVLKQAQDLGYAEADPTADVEGHDVRAKIFLLAQLAMGGVMSSKVDEVPCKGISKLTVADFKFARSFNSTIKLIGAAQRLDDQTVSIYVTPAMIHNNHSLASIDGVGNAVFVDSKNLGPCLYSGPGAGRYPTANSVVADILRLANTTSSNVDTGKTLTLEPSYESQFFIRLSGEGFSFEKAGKAADETGVPILSIASADGDVCITTGQCNLQKVQRMCESLDTSAVFMPMLVQ